MKELINLVSFHLSSTSTTSHVTYTLHKNDTDIERVTNSLLRYAKRNGAVYTAVENNESKVFITFDSYEAMMDCSRWFTSFAYPS